MSFSAVINFIQAITQGGNLLQKTLSGLASYIQPFGEVLADMSLVQQIWTIVLYKLDQSFIFLDVRADFFGFGLLGLDETTRL